MTPSQTAPNGPRVLLADDNSVNQTVASKMLEKLGYQADVVSSGGEAIAAMEQHPYDVVLMDVHMPAMGGLEATRAIRERWQHPRPTIIALTASDVAEDRRRCEEAGMDGFLTKPLKTAQLEATLDRFTAAAEPAEAGGDSQCLRLQAQLEEFTAMFGEDTAVELLGLFLADTPPRLDLLQAAIDGRDAEETRRTAHALKGGCATLGIEAMAEVCKQLELEAKAGELDQASTHLETIRREFENVRAFAARLEANRLPHPTS